MIFCPHKQPSYGLLVRHSPSLAIKLMPSKKRSSSSQITGMKEPYSTSLLFKSQHKDAEISRLFFFSYAVSKYRCMKWKKMTNVAFCQAWCVRIVLHCLFLFILIIIMLMTTCEHVWKGCRQKKQKRRAKRNKKRDEVYINGDVEGC